MTLCYLEAAHRARLMVQFLSSDPHYASCTTSYFSSPNYTLKLHYNDIYFSVALSGMSSFPTAPGYTSTCPSSFNAIVGWSVKPW